jgi:hypothetical protein
MKTLALGKVAAILMSAGLVLGLLGSGVGASFIWNGQVSQPITVGSGTLVVGACNSTLSSCTDNSWGPNLAPALPSGWGPACVVDHITSPAGSMVCMVVVLTPGDIYPTAWVLTPSVSGTIHEPHLWTITDTALAATAFSLDALGSFPPAGFSPDWGYFVPGGSTVTPLLPNGGHAGYASAEYAISWNNLTNVSFGDAFTINLTVVAQ